MQRRFLNLHEYQSKGLMASYGIRVQKGKVASTPEEAKTIAEELVSEDAKELIVKAQIHAGGRGHGHFDTGFRGGVQVLGNAKEVEENASKMLGNSLITKQTGPKGQLVSKVLVHEGVTFSRELYLAILMDRSHHGPIIICSKEGGMDIEDVAAKDPTAIHTRAISIEKGIARYDSMAVAEALGLAGKQLLDACHQIEHLYNLFISCDATQVEINPMVVTDEGLVYCVDAKINFDENASFRQEEIFQMRDESMEDARDVAASKYNLNYIGLNGNIGCMVNGAGLAMATMDLIQLHGGAPANFLDVGGAASEKQVEEAFKILTSDINVKAILVNIFGGIVKCDTIAAGIINAAKNVKMEMPLIVRLEGTNVDKARKMIEGSNVEILAAANLDDAARMAVAAI
eukprot:CAMPEP_0185257928 /NCGR_PEP_ID=MMETSP1359-20130426/6932_1 /TAXON_ID=552665 /ORGANISM="Bigelowiella longifila, Strain CCMP242" /LENGTH=400 /DNA_ID=CAMNT_0027843227 /DNA_START=287 /DNA_END=1489 /DNA_ORIENTATION=+